MREFRVMVTILRRFGVVSALLAAAGLAAAQQPAQHTTEAPSITEGPTAMKAQPALMNNDSVLKMHAAGVADGLIVQTIVAQPGKYDTDADSLIALKKAGIADPILDAMTNKARRQITKV